MSPNFLPKSPIEIAKHKQRIASDPNKSAWVFASAGSGKTKILTDRVLRLLLNSTNPHKIICLTFTKVAAIEMHERIHKELINWNLMDIERLTLVLQELTGFRPSQKEILKAKSLIIKLIETQQKIRIQTIHSFCQGLLKSFPFESGTNPNFELLDEIQNLKIIDKIREKILNLTEHNQEIAELVFYINQKLNEDKLSELIMELIGKGSKFFDVMEKYGNMKLVISQIFHHLGFESDDLEQEKKQIISHFLCEENLGQLQKILIDFSQIKNATHQNYCNIINSLLSSNYNDSLIESLLGDYYEIFFIQSGDRRKKLGSNSEESNYLIEIQGQKIHEAQEKLTSLKIAKDSAALLKFVNFIWLEYQKEKKSSSLLVYNDLISKTNHLLENSEDAMWVKKKIDAGFDHILIDESQDTNHRQWSIIKAITEDFFSGESASHNSRSIFVVGDEKQSIFSFQGAEPNISSEIFEYFNCKIPNLQKIDLSISFRSQQNILSLTDQIFSNSKYQNAISKATSYQAHTAIREGLGIVEIWPCINNPKQKSVTKLDFQHSSIQEEQSDEEILAEKIVEKIYNQVNELGALPAKKQYGDFMILLRRKTTKLFGAIIHKLQLRKIPFSTQGKNKFSKELLILDMISVAQFVANPYDDLNLANLLHSPFFDISEQELLEACLKKNKEQLPLYHSLEESISLKLQEFRTLYLETNDVFGFFYALIETKNYRSKFIKHSINSSNLLDNFLLFTLEISKKSMGLQEFIHHAQDQDPDIVISSFDEDNCVKISTIHSAKGLESKVVFLPDCCYDQSLALNKDRIFWHEGLPLWCARQERVASKIITSCKSEKNQAAEEESLRLLYVALTRARDELYVAGFGSSNKENSWYNIISNA